MTCKDSMTFPATFDEFAEQYKIVDSKEVYTNGAELIPIFRVKQWLEHISVFIEGDETMGKFTNEHTIKAFTVVLDLIKQKDAEIERLKEYEIAFKKGCALSRCINKGFVQDEAYKEFADVVFKTATKYIYSDKNTGQLSTAEAMLWFKDAIKDTLTVLTGRKDDK